MNTGTAAANTAFDPVTAEVIRMGLEEIVEEMATVLTRTSGSPALTEAQDFSTALFDARGEHIAYSGYVTLHMASSLLAVQSLLETVPVESMNPGDAWLSNDPHVTGAMHPPDWGLVTPLFNAAELIGFAWSEAHLLDSGGITPGGFGVGATDAYGECLRFPHIKLLDRGRFNTEVEHIISNNVRVPVLVLNDIRSFVAANKVCEARLGELVRRHGDEFERYVEILKHLSEQQLRARIGRIPNGVWSTCDWQEHNGHRNELFEQQGRLTVKDDAIELWFDGDPETDGLINGHYGSLVGSVLTSLCQLLFWDIPFNAGVLRCIEVDGAKGTVVNCRPPAPISSAHMDSGMKVTKITTELISKALAQSEDAELRARASAQFQDCWAANIWYGTDQYQSPTVFVNMDGGGCGAGAQTVVDGLDVGATMCSPASSIPDIEINEQLYPVLFLWRGLYRDSGGPGALRGGLGLDACWIPWGTEELVGTLNASCGAVPPRGAMGGYPASTTTFAAMRDVGVLEHFAEGRMPGRRELGRTAETFPIKETGIRIRGDGRDAFIYTLGGGAGLGDPLLRDPALVASDVRDRYVTSEQARSAYGVVFRSDGAVDPTATEACRAEIRRDRLGREPVRQIGIQDRQGPSVHLYLERVGMEVACTLCGELLLFENGEVAQAALRRREVSEALQSFGAAALRHGEGELLLEERFCPGCGTSLQVTTVRATEAALESIR
jgi:N-methylhydantoinase B